MLQVEKKKMEVYEKLNQLGYEGSIVTTDCPFAELNKLEDRLFFIRFP